MIMIKPRHAGRGADATKSDCDTSLAPQIAVVNPVHNSPPDPTRITYRRCPDFIIDYHATRRGRYRLAAALIRQPNAPLSIAAYTDEPAGEICRWLLGRLKLDIQPRGDQVLWTGQPLSIAATDTLVAVEVQLGEAVKALHDARFDLRLACAAIKPTLDSKRVAEAALQKARSEYKEARKKRTETAKHYSSQRAAVRSLKLLQADAIAASAISPADFATESYPQLHQGATAGGSTSALHPGQAQTDQSGPSGRERIKVNVGHIRSVDEANRPVLEKLAATLEQILQALKHDETVEALSPGE